MEKISTPPNHSTLLNEPPTEPSDGLTFEVYYRNQYSSAYKRDEQALKRIVKNHVSCKKSSDKLKFTIYYQSHTIKSLVTRNSNYSQTPTLQQTNLVYEYKCNKDDCERLHNSSYVGFTTCTLSRRLTMHLQSGGPKQHTTSRHNDNITRTMLENNTKIIRRETDPIRLPIYEALLIQQKKPVINNQAACFNRTLKLFNSVSLPEIRQHQRELQDSSRPPVPPLPAPSRNIDNINISDRLDNREIPLRRSARNRDSLRRRVLRSTHSTLPSTG